MPLVCVALAPHSWHCFTHIRSSRASSPEEALSKIQSLIQSGGSYEYMVVSFEPSKLAVLHWRTAQQHAPIAPGWIGDRTSGDHIRKQASWKIQLSIRMLVQRSPWSAASRTSELIRRFMDADVGTARDKILDRCETYARTHSHPTQSMLKCTAETSDLNFKLSSFQLH